MGDFIALLMLIIIAAAGWLFLAELPGFSNPILATALFVLISGLSLASLWKPKLKILGFSIASIVLFYGWISSANIWYLAGAIGLAIAVIAFLRAFRILAALIAFLRILRKLAPFIRS